jgi:hypothetical protein
VLAVALVVLAVLFLIEMPGSNSGDTGTGEIRPGQTTAP